MDISRDVIYLHIFPISGIYFHYPTVYPPNLGLCIFSIAIYYGVLVKKSCTVYSPIDGKYTICISHFRGNMREIMDQIATYYPCPKYHIFPVAKGVFFLPGKVYVVHTHTHTRFWKICFFVLSGFQGNKNRNFLGEDNFIQKLGG